MKFGPVSVGSLAAVGPFAVMEQIAAVKLGPVAVGWLAVGTYAFLKRITAVRLGSVSVGSLAAIGPFAVVERMATVELGACCYFVTCFCWAILLYRWLSWSLLLLRTCCCWAICCY